MIRIKVVPVLKFIKIKVVPWICVAAMCFLTHSYVFCFSLSDLTEVCNFAGGTFHACDNLNTLEHYASLAIELFENDNMRLNKDK